MLGPHQSEIFEFQFSTQRPLALDTLLRLRVDTRSATRVILGEVTTGELIAGTTLSPPTIQLITTHTPHHHSSLNIREGEQLMELEL